MNTRDRSDLADDFELVLREGLDRLAGGTRTATPQAFDPDALPISTLTMPEQRRLAPYLVTAAAVTVAVVGLTTLQRDDTTRNDGSAGTQPVTTSPSTPSTDDSQVAAPAPTTASSTTTVSSPGEIVPAGSVVCIDAGGGQQAAAWCDEELGGGHIVARAWSDETFMMAANPTDTRSVDATNAAAQATNSAVRDLDPQYLPSGFTRSTDVTTYYVLGARSPYAAASLTCSSGSDVTVPDVAGQPYIEAIDTLLAAGLIANPARELPPPGETATAADYSVVRQDTMPGASSSCGTAIDIVLAYRPGILYVVQEGDSWASVASDQGISLDQLLSFSGLTLAELESSGQSPNSPLPLGQALPLSAHPATLNTVPTGTSP